MKNSFTLIELLIVIAIIATLSVVVVLVINPVEYLKQTRDSKRLTELKSIDSSLTLASISGLPLGLSNTVYVSLSDTSLTCANLGLPSLPSGWFYACKPETDYRKVNGNGWIPVNFSSITWGSPLSILPIDPVNATSSGLYYTYVSGGSWKLTAILESEKRAPAMVKDGGPDVGLYEIGSNLNLANFQRGLVGYWKFDETSGALYDSSGSGNDGTQFGGVTYGVAGKAGTALSFDGDGDYISISNFGNVAPTTEITISLWIYSSDVSQQSAFIFANDDGYNRINFHPCYSNGFTYWDFGDIFTNGRLFYANPADCAGRWNYYTLISSVSGNYMSIYRNGILDANKSGAGTFTRYNDNLQIGGITSFWYSGLIDDVRIYNRALSRAEVQAIYNATK